ncbi:hypothetical protein GJAV_G00034740 [Gymnothorax javanicus]|nr:hypothetical protein GJAV_G00034740 [Gymnothorax javanicus]
MPYSLSAKTPESLQREDIKASEMRGYLLLLGFAMCQCLFGQALAESLGSRYILSAVEEARRIVDEAYKYSREMSLERLRRNTISPANKLRVMKLPCGETRNIVRAADYMENTLRIIQEKVHHNSRRKRSLNATDLLTPEELSLIATLTGCKARVQPVSCRTTPQLNKYRTASSTCNNLNDTRLGAANTPLARWLPAQYQDGISLPIGWDPEIEVNGHLLPLVRAVSNRIMSVDNEDVVDDDFFSHLLTVFGQWIDHDISLTPMSPSIRSFSSGINCDESCQRVEPCFPIELPKDDPKLQVDKCMSFTRSAPGCGTGTSGYMFGAGTVREQMNVISSYIDAGMVYGSSEAMALDLRDLTSDEGLLRVNDRYDDYGREHLPFSKTKIAMCATRNGNQNTTDLEEVPCSFTGDSRADENIALTAIHALMMREHNRLVRALYKLNPHWTSETLYQEARKIMGAYQQVLTYRDYLPFVVGPEFMSRDLSNYPGYNESVDPSCSNVFATAAFRFAHVAVHPIIFRLDENYNEHPEYPNVLLHKALFTPWRIYYEGGLDPIVRGMVGRKTKLQAQDGMMPEEMRNLLFKFTRKLALDLASLNLQRGRDHGLQGYNAWRKFCGLSQPQTVEELAEVMNNTELAQKLMEMRPCGTPLCLLDCSPVQEHSPRRQAVVGERWSLYQPTKSSPGSSKFARMICDNTGITEVPRKPFLFKPRGSGYTRCEDIPAFDLSPWQESHGSDDDSTGLQGPPGPAGSGPTQHSAFAVRLGHSNPTPNTTIVFREVLYNKQKHYSTETGIFTCAVTGAYQIDFHLTIFNNAGSVDLMHNGNLVLHSFTTRQTGFITASGGTILMLNEGDELWLKANFGGNSITEDSFFSGHLIIEE